MIFARGALHAALWAAQAEARPLFDGGRAGAEGFLSRPHDRARAGLKTLWREHGHDPAALEHLDPTGREPVLPSSFADRHGDAGERRGIGVAAAEIWHARTGRRAKGWRRDARRGDRARSERYLTIDGGPAPELWDKIAGIYECGDGRYVRLHTNFPHHRDGVLKLLQWPTTGRPSGKRSRLEGRRFRGGSGAKRSSSSRRCARSPNGTRIHKAPRSPPAVDVDRADRRCAGAGMAIRRAAARRHQGARPHPHHRRPGVRADARRARRRRDAGDGAASAVGAPARHRHRARQAVDPNRSARAGRPRRFEALLREADIIVQGYRRARSRRSASDRRRLRSCAPASSMSLCGLRRTRARGPDGAASIRWCRPRAASTPPKRRRPASAARSPCRRRCSITPRAICWPLAR